MLKIVWALSCLFCLSAFADPKIKEGDWELGGAASLSTDRYGTYFSLDGTTQYFLRDHFSLGLSAGYRGWKGPNYLSLGPVFTKYFFVKDNFAPYISLTPLKWSSFGKSSNLESTVRVGTKFFLNDYVSFGPALEHSHTWKKGGTPSYSNTSLLGVFSIHL